MAFLGKLIDKFLKTTRTESKNLQTRYAPIVIEDKNENTTLPKTWS